MLADPYHPSVVAIRLGHGGAGEAVRQSRILEVLEMTLVLLTAVSVWVLMQILSVVDVGNWLIESTIAVLGGAAIGFIGAWYLRRRARKERRG